MAGFWIWSGCWRGFRLDSAGPRDVRALAASLARLPGLKTAMEAMQAPLWRELIGRLDTLEDVTARIATTLVAEPPLTLVDGGAIAAGVDAELDELRAISIHGPAADCGDRGAGAGADGNWFAEGAL